MSMRQSKFTKSLFAVGLTLLTTPVFAWGGSGHWLVGRIAELQATAQTRKSIAELLEQDQDIPPQKICGSNSTPSAKAWHKPTSLSQIASFPDQIRTAPIGDGSASWHFVNIEYDDPGASFNWLNYCKAKFRPKYKYDSQNSCYIKLDVSLTTETAVNNSCSIAKIEDFFRVLAQTKSTAADKIWALKFLVHLIGDAHQPLHNAVWNNDRGGNLRGVSLFNDPDPFYGPLNLHSVWDDNMLERMIRKQIYNDESPRRLTDSDLENYAQYLNAKMGNASAPTPFSQSYAQQLLTAGPTEWGWTALQKAVRFAYAGFTADYKPLPSSGSQGQDVQRVVLTRQYYENAIPVIEQQIALGASRLAALLNQAFEWLVFGAFAPKTNYSSRNQR